MALTTAQLVALKAEVTANPGSGYGFAAIYNAGNDTGLASALNFRRDGATPCPVNNVIGAAITVRRPDIAAKELLEAVDTRDFINSPTVLQGSWFESITQQPTIRLVNDDGSNTTAFGNFTRILNNTNGSQTRLAAIASRNGSRAEQLFGFGVGVSTDDIAQARQS
jgi:hypothetical protein